MKNLLLIAMMLMSSFSFADTTDIRELLFNGADNYAEVNLTTEKTRTEYRTVTVPSTCYRTEYRRSCTRPAPVCRQVCRDGNCRRVCSGGGAPICRTIPVQVAYRCMRQETRAYEVHDYYVETTVRFEFNNTDVANDASEKFKIQMTGERASLSVDSSKNYIIVLDNQSRAEDRQAGVKYVDLTYKVNFVPAGQLNNVLADGIKNVTYKRGILTFKLGAGFNFQDFTQNLKVYQNRRLGSDTLLLDKVIADNEANVQTTSNASVISIDINALGIQAPAKARIILETKYNIDANTVLNRNELKLEDSANWVFR